MRAGESGIIYGEDRMSTNHQFDKEESLRYLLVEYQQCFEHMRHHNNISISLAKFIYTILAALGTGAFALFKYLEGEAYQYLIVGSVVLFALVIGIAFSALMVRNRIYFVIVARQVNSIRNYLISRMKLDFSNYNKCYLDSSKPKAFNLNSSYLLILLIISLLNGIAGGLGYYLIANYLEVQGIWARGMLGMIIGIAIAVSSALVISIYLRVQDKLRRQTKGS